MTPTDWTFESCPAASETHRVAAMTRQGQLTKPPGSLGRLEQVAIALAALQATETPTASRAPIVLFAGDHGITARGVSAFPSAVTVEMLKNFARGGAAISVMAKSLEVPLTVVDVGTLARDPVPGVVTDKCRTGTDDFSAAPAMRAGDLAHALNAGKRAVAATRSPDLILFGEMGIGNTTAAAAVAAALLGCDASTVVGAGTGVDDEGQARKTQIIDAALSMHRLDSNLHDEDTGDFARRALSHVGGLEIAALSGAMIAAAQARVPVLVDGFIVTVAALAGVRINPSLRPWLLFSHRSHEQGHTRVLEALDARPLLDLDLRLGEGSGAAVALPLIRSACALHNGMATFAEASVSDGS